MKILALLCLLSPQESTTSLDQLVQQADSQEPAAILRSADAAALDLSELDFERITGEIGSAEGAKLLLYGRLQAWAEEPIGGEHLVRLLDGESLDWSLATLQTLRLPAYQGVEEISSGLATWLSDLIAEDSPGLWAEGQYTLFRIGSGIQRRASLRTLRSVLWSEDQALRNKAVLALGRTGSALGTEEYDVLQVLAEGIGTDATLAQTLLDQVAQQARFRSKIEALQKLNASEKPNAIAVENQQLAVLEEILLRVHTQHMEGEKYTDEELINAAADGMLRLLDPHSTFFSGEEYGEFVFDMMQAYGGIGAYVNTVDNVFTIMRPIYSGPAYAAGLLSGDQIFAVDGWSTADQPNDEIIKRLKGEPGTEVLLQVYRNGWTEPHDIPVIRDRIKLPTLQSELLPGNILYLELLDFSEDVARMIVDAIGGAMEGGTLNGVVLDLRNNGGGYLREAVQICDVFLPKDKVVVTTKSRTGADETYRTRVRALIPEDIPLAVLINDYSASASEIVSGTLSVHGRAITVGKRTYGKGSVQNVFQLDSQRDERFEDTSPSRDIPRNGVHDEWENFQDSNENGTYDYGSRVKLTIAYYFLPDGSTIHTQRDHDGRVVDPGGVEPDREVEFPEMEFVVARELSRLLEDKDPFRPYAERIFDEDKELAVNLAINDNRDVSRYPGWDEFYTGLDTELEAQEVRRWVRRQLRAVVSDARGKVFPGNGFAGDYVEDPQLREAIRAVLESTSLTYDAIPEYADLLARR
ncbi:MAG: S41 family peptidase [Planctomycetota bacterium]|jgi:C-terminal peptidase prc